MLGLLKGRLIPVRVVLLTATLSLALIGIATIYAVGHPAKTDFANQSAQQPADKSAQQPADESGELADLWKKQVAFAGLGIGALILVNLVSYRRLGEAGYWIYAAVLLLLAVLLISRFVVELALCPGNQRRLQVDKNIRRGLRPAEHPAVGNMQARVYDCPGLVSAIPQQLPKLQGV